MILTKKEEGDSQREEKEVMFLEIHNLKKSYGDGETRTEVLRGIDFSVAKGEICVLLGPSGSGKSTLLNIIGGIDDADEGYISIEGEKTADMNEKTLTKIQKKASGLCVSDVQSDSEPECKGKCGSRGLLKR